MTLPSTVETAIIHCMPEVPPDKLFSLTAKKKNQICQGDYCPLLWHTENC